MAEVVTEGGTTTFGEDFVTMRNRLVVFGAGERAVLGVVAGRFQAIYRVVDDAEPPRIDQICLTSHNGDHGGLTATYTQVAVNSADVPVIGMGRHTYELSGPPDEMYAAVADPTLTPTAQPTVARSVAIFDTVFGNVESFVPAPAS